MTDARRTSLQPSYADSQYVDAQGRTDAELYLMGVLDGSIVAGKRLRQLAERMLPRVRNGYGRWRYDADFATRPVEFIERFLMIPSGKLGVPFTLEPYERMIVELIFGFVDENEKRQIQYALIIMARKQGKALSLDTEIPTLGGWKPMRDVHPGDYVFGQDGRPSKVLVESEVFDKPMYLVTFEDGATIKASADHVWTVQTKRSRSCARNYKTDGFMHPNLRRFRNGGWFEVTTQEMADDESFVHHRADGKGVGYKYRVPMSLPVEYPAKDLPIDPYVFGAWLGDGTSSKAQITIGREDENEMVRNLSLRGHLITKHECPSMSDCGASTYDIDHHPRDGGKRHGPFKQKLIDLGVLNDKHIPDIYMQGSVMQRWELLRGLMDTDGHCSKAGQCEFTQKRKIIAEQLVELCASLGIKATMRSKHATCNGVPAGVVYCVRFYTDKEHSCFHLQRKHNRLKDRLASRMSCKSIVNIEAIPNEPSKCIAIDNDSHLYLAGRQYTATHNTSLAAAIEIYMLLCDGEGAPQIYNAATSKGQASLAYGAVWRMVRQSPKLSKYLRKGVVTERAETGIICDQNMGYVVPLSKQSDHLDGLDVHMCVLDEMAAAEDRSIFDLVRQGTGAREQPLFVSISTNGFVRDGLFDSEHQYGYDWLDGKLDDDRFLPIFFEQDDRSEVFGGNERMWLKSNPGLMHPDAGHINGGVKSLEYLRSQVIKAKNDSSYMPTLLTKDFNIPANSATAFLTFEEAVNKTPYVFDPNEFRYCVVGMDAADSLDLNAATALFMRPGDNHIYRKSMYWISEEQVKQNNNSMRGRDGVPYTEYASRGLLRIVPENYVPRRVFVDWVRELAEMGLYTSFVGYDPWRMENILPDLKSMIGEANVEPVRQGPRTYSDPLKQMKAEMRAGRIIDGGNSIDHMCNLNAAVKVDSNANYTVVKKDGPTSRIDGFMALLDAYIALQRHYEEYLSIIGWYPPEENHQEI